MPERSSTAAKRLFKTSEVCQLTDTQPYVLRFWESEFPQLSPKRQGGQTVYRREDVDLVRRIKRLLYDEEYTIDGARRRLDQELSGAAEPPASSREEPDPDEAAAEARSLIGLAEPEAPAPPAAAEDVAAVSRERYEDAIEEIAHLRLKLREAEAAARKLETRAQNAERGVETHRDKAREARLRLEQLLERLG